MDFLSPFLKTGTTLASFQSTGTIPVLYIRVKIIDKGSASTFEHRFKTMPGSSSGPQVLLTFMSFKSH